MNIYVELTKKFNVDHVRTMLAGGQAAVLHRLAFMSKDGDWILREQQQDLDHILKVLEGYGAKYRFGSPLDLRWLSCGWSAHLEFQWQGLRVRTDFVTRPARIDPETLERMWKDTEEQPIPFASARDLAEMKKTNREKDYVVIGELTRRMKDPESQILYSRSARDLITFSQQYPDLIKSLGAKRPLLRKIDQGRENLEAALDLERRQLIRANEERLANYLEAAKPWASSWRDLSRRMQGLSLPEAHQVMVEHAQTSLPKQAQGGSHD